MAAKKKTESEQFLKQFSKEWKNFKKQSETKAASFTHFVKTYPFVAMGLAFVLGFLLGRLRRKR